MTATVPTDAALVAAARSGSDAAFARLVDRHQQAVRSFLRRICANESDADDIAQDAFLAAWTALATLKDKAGFRAWLFSIAWRRAKGAARSAARSRQRDGRWMQERPENETPGGELKIAMQQALSQLPEEQRAAVALCLAGDWTHADAATILDMPLGTVKSHIARGRSRLETILGVGHDT